jgi:hypothetical protein
VLTRAHQQEGLCRAFIQAVASRCGCSCAFRDFDYGIDVTVHHIKARDRRRVESGVRLDIQAKSTTTASIGTKFVHYDLEVKSYEDLRDLDTRCPRILVLLVLPDDDAEWLAITEEHLLLRRCAYWLNLQGHPQTTNKDTVRVQIPRSHVFSAAALAGILERAQRGEQP